MSTPPTSPPDYYLYLDDSGSEDSGILTYSWIAVRVRDVSQMNRMWLTEARQPLARDFGVPVDYPLHARKFVRSRTERASACELMLGVLGDCPQLHLGTVYRHTHKKQKDFTGEKFAFYRDTLAHIDSFLAARKATATLFVDGRGSHRHREESRALRLRNLREPVFQPLEEVQLLQAVDLVAWTVYQHILCDPGKELVSGWYDTFLRRRDINGGPLMLAPGTADDHSSSIRVSLSGLATA